MNCLYIHSSDKKLDEIEKLKLYKNLLNTIHDKNIKHIFWSNDPYNTKNYTSIIQMLMRTFEYDSLLFTCIIDDNDAFNEVLQSFVKYHHLQLSIFLKNIKTPYIHILERNHGYYVYEYKHEH